MKEEAIIDARAKDHVIAQGSELRKMIKATIISYQAQNLALLKRMNLELVDKESAVTLMVAIGGDDPTLNDQALFFKTCVAKAVWLEKEIRFLNTFAQSFSDGKVYRLTLEDSSRCGL